MRKRLLLQTIAVLCLGTFASADAFITSGSRASGFTTDVINWGQLGPPGTFVNTPALVTSVGGTNAALVGNANLGQFLTAQEGCGGSWCGNFDFGENLVWTGNRLRCRWWRAVHHGAGQSGRWHRLRHSD